MKQTGNTEDIALANVEGPPHTNRDQETNGSPEVFIESRVGTNADVIARNDPDDAVIDVAPNTHEQAPSSRTTIEKQENAASNAHAQHTIDDKPYSVFNHTEKMTIVLCAGFSAFFSPISGQIYFPSLDAIAADLHVSNSLVNLTMTTYLVSNSNSTEDTSVR